MAIDPIRSFCRYKSVINLGISFLRASDPHVSDIELLAFAAGTRDEKKQSGIANHVCECARCRAFVRSMEHVGGIVLENLPPTPLAGGSYAAVMAQIDLYGQVERGHREGAERI